MVVLVATCQRGGSHLDSKPAVTSACTDTAINGDADRLERFVSPLYCLRVLVPMSRN